MNQVKVRRGNVILRISEEQIPEYMNKGYDVLNKDGSILQKSIPNNLPYLQEEYVKLLDENKTLKEELSQKNPSDEGSEDIQNMVEQLQTKNDRLVSANKDLKEQLKNLKKELKDTEKKLAAYE